MLLETTFKIHFSQDQYFECNMSSATILYRPVVSTCDPPSDSSRDGGGGGENPMGEGCEKSGNFETETKWQP